MSRMQQMQVLVIASCDKLLLIKADRAILQTEHMQTLQAGNRTNYEADLAVSVFVGTRHKSSNRVIYDSNNVTVVILKKENER